MKKIKLLFVFMVLTTSFTLDSQSTYSAASRGFNSLPDINKIKGACADISARFRPGAVIKPGLAEDLLKLAEKLKKESKRLRPVFKLSDPRFTLLDDEMVAEVIPEGGHTRVVVGKSLLSLSGVDLTNVDPRILEFLGVVHHATYEGSVFPVIALPNKRFAVVDNSRIQVFSLQGRLLRTFQWLGIHSMIQTNNPDFLIIAGRSVSSERTQFVVRTIDVSKSGASWALPTIHASFEDVHLVRINSDEFGIAENATGRVLRSYRVETQGFVRTDNNP